MIGFQVVSVKFFYNASIKSKNYFVKKLPIVIGFGSIQLKEGCFTLIISLILFSFTNIVKHS